MASSNWNYDRNRPQLSARACGEARRGTRRHEVGLCLAAALCGTIEREDAIRDMRDVIDNTACERSFRSLNCLRHPVTPARVLLALVVLQAAAFPLAANAGRNAWTTHDVSAGEIKTIAVHPQDARMVYAGGLCGVFKSVDRGVSWESRNVGLAELTEVSGTFERVSIIVVDPIAVDTAYVGTPVGIFKTSDGAESWQPMSAGLSRLEVLSLAVDASAAGTVYAGGFAGVATTTDGGASWTSMNDGFVGTV